MLPVWPSHRSEIDISKEIFRQFELVFFGFKRFGKVYVDSIMKFDESENLTKKP